MARKRGAMGQANLTIGQRGAILQDAYWYAVRATGADDMFGGAYSRSQALRRAIMKAHEAGMRLSGRGKRLEHAQAIVYTIEAFAETFGVDARTGEAMRCEQCDKPLTKHDHDGCYWTRETERGRRVVKSVERNIPARQ
jgi:hypothetical protein